ncbi:MAG: 4'-phosphopantetheinyl transferase family protein [Geitlerinemataceae cyanobacterium]
MEPDEALQNVPFRNCPGVSRVPVAAELSDCAIELWEIDLVAARQSRDWEALLSADERDRAARYRQIDDRHQFVTMRGLSRLHLGACLGIAPEAVRFCYGDRGKPAIAPDLQSSPPLEFNTSHSGGVALLSLSWVGAIGVDLEAPNLDRPIRRLAKRFFLHHEIAHLEHVAPQAQTSLFLRYWTCKEAYLKATGVGLSGLKNTPTFRLGRGSVSQSITDSNQRRWILHMPTLQCLYPSAIAIEIT